jgi:hypothetical protein
MELTTLYHASLRKRHINMADAANYWDSIQTLTTVRYRCGYSSCGREVAADRGWFHRNATSLAPDGYLYVCPSYKLLMLFDGAVQYPGISLRGASKISPE